MAGQHFDTLPSWKPTIRSVETLSSQQPPSSECCLTGGVAGTGLVGLFRASAYAPSQRHSQFYLATRRSASGRPARVGWRNLWSSPPPHCDRRARSLRKRIAVRFLVVSCPISRQEWRVSQLRVTSLKALPHNELNGFWCHGRVVACRMHFSISSKDNSHTDGAGSDRKTRFDSNKT